MCPTDRGPKEDARWLLQGRVGQEGGLRQDTPPVGLALVLARGLFLPLTDSAPPRPPARPCKGRRGRGGRDGSPPGPRNCPWCWDLSQASWFGVGGEAGTAIGGWALARGQARREAPARRGAVEPFLLLGRGTGRLGLPPPQGASPQEWPCARSPLPRHGLASGRSAARPRGSLGPASQPPGSQSPSRPGCPPPPSVGSPLLPSSVRLPSQSLARGSTPFRGECGGGWRPRSSAAAGAEMPAGSASGERFPPPLRCTCFPLRASPPAATAFPPLALRICGERLRAEGSLRPGLLAPVREARSPEQPGREQEGPHVPCCLIPASTRRGLLLKRGWTGMEVANSASPSAWGSADPATDSCQKAATRQLLQPEMRGLASPTRPALVGT